MKMSMIVANLMKCGK